MFLRSQAEALDAQKIIELCLGKCAPYGLIEFFKSVPAQQNGLLAQPFLK